MLRRGNSFLYSSTSAAGAGGAEGLLPVPAPSRNEHRAAHELSVLEDLMMPKREHPPIPHHPSLGTLTGFGKAGPAGVLVWLSLPLTSRSLQAEPAPATAAVLKPSQDKQQQTPRSRYLGSPCNHQGVFEVVWDCGMHLFPVETGIAGCTPLCATELHDFQTENGRWGQGKALQGINAVLGAALGVLRGAGGPGRKEGWCSR